MICIKCNKQAKPGWETCDHCIREAAYMRLGVVFVDDLGIGWTESEIDEAGGREEIYKLVKEARV